jgi:hypothetical protein
MAVKRRDVLKAGATAAAVSTVALGQEHAHLLAPDAVGKAANWKPSVLSPEQNELVVTLTEMIIPATDTPGAKAANVNRYIDLFLGESPAEERERFLRGLKWLDDYAMKEGGVAFVKLPPARQTSILERLDAASDASLEDGTNIFRMAKSMTARFYYQTEIGYKELNKHNKPGGWACKHDAHRT